MLYVFFRRRLLLGTCCTPHVQVQHRELPGKRAHCRHTCLRHVLRLWCGSCCATEVKCLQDTNFRPGSTPTSMLSLPNNHVLLGCETGDGCIARLPIPPPGGSAGAPPAVGPSVTSTLPNAAPVWAFTVANLQRLPQHQVSTQ